MPSTISAGTTAGTAIAVAGDTTGNLAFQTNGTTTAMTINTSQQVGIGTTSPTAPLDIQADSGSGAINIRGRVSGDIGSINFYNNTNTTQQFFVQSRSTYSILNTVINGYMAFATNNSEKMRIDSAGRLLFGSTDTNPAVNNNPGVAINANADNNFYAGVIQASATGNTALFLNRGADDGNTASFRRSGTTVGTISVTTSSTSYNTSSDYRLKENIAPMIGALEKVAQLKPCTYTWKATGEAGEGFIAHELQAVVPDAVSGEKDAVDKDGNPEYQGVDTSFLVATLTAAIQELKAELDATKAEVAALKGAA